METTVMSGRTGLAFRGVTKRFGTVLAVDGFDLEIAAGEFVALVGPSGCGKTTSLRILAGLETATSGRVFVGDEDLTDLESRDRNLAMVFQSYALYPHMTAAENIGFALSLKRRPRAEVEAAVRRAAERLAIGHLLDRLPRELSGGQRQRVAVARCIVREPAAFLFDEPLSNLDAKLRASARVEIARLQKDLGITTLYVTHDQVEAMTMADRVVLMEGGRIRQQGAPMDLYERPADLFVAAFLGSPPMNLLPGFVRGEGGRHFATEGLSVPLGSSLPCADGPATLGLRPEDFHLAPADGDAVRLTGTVRHVERLGAETLVRFALSGAPHVELIARLPARWRGAAGDGLTLSLDAAALHLFDASGKAAPLGPDLAGARRRPAVEALSA